jgi:hypothetical protein
VNVELKKNSRVNEEMGDSVERRESEEMGDSVERRESEEMGDSVERRESEDGDWRVTSEAHELVIILCFLPLFANIILLQSYSYDLSRVTTH